MFVCIRWTVISHEGCMCLCYCVRACEKLCAETCVQVFVERPTTETELNDPLSHLAEKHYSCQKLLSL